MNAVREFMTAYVNIYTILIAISVVLAAVLFMIKPAIAIFKSLRRSKRSDKPMRVRLITFSALLLTSVWCLRFAVNFYWLRSGNEINAGMNEAEAVFDSLIHALQTFSMDEDYTAFLLGGKELAAGLFGSAAWPVEAFGIYCSVLNFIAPVAGGALIFEILTSFFPKMRLFFGRLEVWRTKYYFSELNDRSIAIAESRLEDIRAGARRKSPLFIFTDAYVSDDDESANERRMRARSLNAICMDDDITHIKMNKRGRKEIFLIDGDEIKNVSTLAQFAEPSIRKKLNENTLIYNFFQDDAFITIDQAAIKSITKIEKRKVRKADGTEKEVEFLSKDSPRVLRVKSQQNLIFNLLNEHPVFEPLIGALRERDRELNVAILGSGQTGMQMLLDTTWCGQMYGYRLGINVVSQEEQESFLGRLKKYNPEIPETARKYSPLLKMYPGVVNHLGYNEPYFTLRYSKLQLQESCLEDISCTDVYGEENSVKLTDCDYFVVALGNDELNISVAQDLRRKIRLSMGENSKRKATIICIVYDRELCDLLSGSNDPEIKVRTFGSLNTIYSYNNVTMENLEELSNVVQKSYDSITDFNEKYFNRNNADRTLKYLKRPYDRLASIARTLHIKERVFSAFTYMLDNDPEHADIWNEFLSSFDGMSFGPDAFEAYGKLIEDCIKPLGKPITGKNIELSRTLAWLEHRRWNAYTRADGFVGRTIIPQDGRGWMQCGNKSLDFKWHYCLVECSKGRKERTGREDLLDLYERAFDSDVTIYDYPSCRMQPEGTEETDGWQDTREWENMGCDTMLIEYLKRKRG